MLYIITEYVIPFLGGMLLLAVISMIAELPFSLLCCRRERYSLKYKLAVFALINTICLFTIMTPWVGLTYFTYADTMGGIALIILIIAQLASAFITAFVYKKAFKTKTVRTIIFCIIGKVASAIGVLLVFVLFEI